MLYCFPHERSWWELKQERLIFILDDYLPRKNLILFERGIEMYCPRYASSTSRSLSKRFHTECSANNIPPSLPSLFWLIVTMKHMTLCVPYMIIKKALIFRGILHNIIEFTMTVGSAVFLD